ncbi:MAG: hypothetical protein EOP77_06095 [Variovorax sp.]|nr:MAG: hypothetical protein EOP77_06095 [Variovorax sp.]
MQPMNLDNEALLARPAPPRVLAPNAPVRRFTAMVPIEMPNVPSRRRRRSLWRRVASWFDRRR